MRSALILILCLIGNAAWSAETTQVSCSQCRDVYQHPEDYGNFAYNSVFGSNPTLSFTDGDIVRVIAPNGQWAIVDLNFVLEPLGLSVNIVILNYAIAVPNGRIQMVIQDPRGDITTREVYALSPDLMVGDGTVTQPPPPPPPAPDPAPVSSAADLQDVNFTQYATGSSTGGFGTMCCQTGEFYWYYDMPEFRIQTYPE